jgi:signal transduction histidine kinase
MFTSARIKLTFWYLLIISTICILFSFTVYRISMLEFRRSLRAQSFRFMPNSQLFDLAPQQGNYYHGMPTIDGQLPTTIEELFEQTRQRITTQLLLVNLAIITASGFAAYFLAGRTLAPIESMVDEQKRFVADASHELRTPLTAIKTEIEVGLRDKKLHLQQAKDLLKSNLEEVDKMQILANYLLQLSKYQNGKLQLAFSAVRLDQLTNDAIRRVTGSANQKKVTITPQLAQITALVNADSIRELLIILLDNAVKYSHESGEVLVRLTQSKHAIVFEVEDHGVGIKASQLPYIFNRFYRADASRHKTTADGYGLGLAIAKSIAELHNGSIEVHSTPAKGSTFKVTLPHTLTAAA